MRHFGIKIQKFFWGGAQPPPQTRNPTPLGASTSPFTNPGSALGPTSKGMGRREKGRRVGWSPPL